MIGARGPASADIRYDGKDVVVQTDPDANNTAVVQGSFDDATGTMTLTLANGTQIRVPGFLTLGSIGVGPAGQQGISGTNGADGLLGVDGLQGPTGCQGPAGLNGATGPQGAQGIQGIEGRPGPQGEKGDTGDTGVVAIYIQSDDPGAVGPGALWVKP